MSIKRGVVIDKVKQGRPLEDEPPRETLTKVSFLLDDETRADLQFLIAIEKQNRVRRPQGAVIRKAIRDAAAATRAREKVDVSRVRQNDQKESDKGG